MLERLGAEQRSVTVKILVIALLVLLLLVPVGMIEGLIRERMGQEQTALRDIQASWGRAQTISGPILGVPYREVTPSRGKPAKPQLRHAYFLPERLAVQGRLRTELRYRGLYEFPVYTADLEISGRFAVPDFSALGIAVEDLLWDQAFIAVPITDARSLRRNPRFELEGRQADFAPGGVKVPGFATQVLVPWRRLADAPMNRPMKFSLKLLIGGSGSLDFLPLGDQTDIRLESDWANVGFGGAYLPGQRQLDASGFKAHWTVLHLGRGFPRQWLGAQLQAKTLKAAAFGVGLRIGAGHYLASVRAAKYAVLFLALVFLAYFLFEVFAGLRLHPLQYVLTGFANCLFYLLLLSLSEQLVFALAYTLSALACTALISLYSASVLKARRRAWIMFAMLALLYGFLYVLLKAEDFALLMGAGGLFVILAAVMFLTRHIDWYALGGGTQGGPPPAAQVAL